MKKGGEGDNVKVKRKNIFAVVSRNARVAV
jgi:hypothetical protein